MDTILIAVLMIVAIPIFFWAMRDNIRELKAYNDRLGSLRFWSIFASIFAWIGIGSWLSVSLKYPEMYGSTCRRKCLPEQFWYSPSLIANGHGSIKEWAMFVWLWSMPTLFVSAIIYAFVTKRGIFKKN
jgi:hypothetical protein